MPYLSVSVGLFVWHNAWAAMLGYHLLMALVLLLNRNKVDPGCIRPTRRYKLTVLAAAGGAAGGLLIFLLWPYLNIPADTTAQLARLGLDQSNRVLFLVYFSAVNPWLEEIYWRGYLGHPALYPVITDFLFAGYHVLVLAGKMDPQWLAVIMVVMVAAAWLWRQLNRLSGGWLPSILSHFAADLSIMLVVFLLLFK